MESNLNHLSPKLNLNKQHTIMSETKQVNYRQGDVLLTPAKSIAGKTLPHLTLAEGEVTGHKHQIIEGEARLYERNGTLYLSVLSEWATLSHEEHKPIAIPQGDWNVKIQREYVSKDLEKFISD
jgi:hypothetical protein